MEAITAYQVVLRTFDGQIVYFMPTAVVMASPIVNYSHNTQPPGRAEPGHLRPVTATSSAPARIDAGVDVGGMTIAAWKIPPAAVFVTGAKDGKVTLFAFCWVEPTPTGSVPATRLFVNALARE